ncbi:dTMP kinase [Candidatus Caldarchaeum subterraneum]|uniref:Probable thymidylate kinase n=1 Tax=Caldiarchaeum subterraneum TaxID=311458 RepID=E6P7S9_CALS0|nr:dTMP kinase [Candidatus Caldarchaeum subterraneum]BAJ49990.1 dTMP kinase [Candidatus Caldarchaeum subterraneum]
MKTFYIAVEGIDGAGKTTQAKLLARKLTRHGFRVMNVHEPTDGKIGGLIREALAKRVNMSEEVLALLFAADRLTLREKIVSAKQSGVYVVSDRSVVSSLAYQSAALGLRNWVYEVNRFAVKPDIIVYIDISPETALKRLRKKSQRYENMVFLRKVKNAYSRVLHDFRRVVVVDGEQPVDAVAETIVEKLSRFIPVMRFHA